MFMGLGERTTQREASRPGVYQVVYEGGIRFRRSACMQDLASTKSLALFNERFAVLRFENDANGVGALSTICAL